MCVLKRVTLACCRYCDDRDDYNSQEEGVPGWETIAREQGVNAYAAANIHGNMAGDSFELCRARRSEDRRSVASSVARSEERDRRSASLSDARYRDSLEWQDRRQAKHMEIEDLQTAEVVDAESACEARNVTNQQTGAR